MVAPLLMPILKFAVPALLSGIMGKKQAKREAAANAANIAYQEGREKTQFVRMRNAAEKAGFNPLTVLRSGGAQGFQKVFAPALASRNYMGEALLGAANNFFGGWDPNEAAKEELEMNLLRANAANLNARTSAIIGRNSAGMSGAGAVSARAALAKPIAPTAGKVTVTNPYTDLEVNPNYLDAEAFEARYGEGMFADTGILIRNGLADLSWNVGKSEAGKNMSNFFSRVRKTPEYRGAALANQLRWGH